jgi:hypothetical protein
MQGPWKVQLLFLSLTFLLISALNIKNVERLFECQVLGKSNKSQSWTYLGSLGIVTVNVSLKEPVQVWHLILMLAFLLIIMLCTMIMSFMSFYSIYS